jgi:hypothetical protein
MKTWHQPSLDLYFRTIKYPIISARIKGSQTPIENIECPLFICSHSMESIFPNEYKIIIDAKNDKSPKMTE